MTTDVAADLEKLLSDRYWRLNNLYRVQNEAGEDVPFVMNDAQNQLWDDLHPCNIIPKARQLGFSTFICIFILDTCLFRPNTNAGTIDITLDDAKKKLEKIKFAYDRLPSEIRNCITLVTENKQSLEWSNGSSASVGTSHRGGTLQILHVSEFGKIAAKYPDKAREIRTGAFGTIHPGMMIFIESTAEGASGAFHELTMQAKADKEENRRLSPQDFKLHFYPWHAHKGYVDDPESRVVPQELQEYFDKLEEEDHISLTPDQRAWYVAKRRSVGPDDMLREYPATLEEAFNVSLEGAYFKEQMSKIRTGGRLLRIPLNPSLPVNTFWDIGVDDSTSVWFHQAGAGGSHALIDYYEASGEGVDFYVKMLEDKRLERGWTYGKHFGPHDLDNRDWSAPGAKSGYDAALELGLQFEIVPRIANKIDAINAARTFLSVAAIDEQYCAQGIKCLDNYRKKWNERLSDWSSEPLHDWSSHGADALMTGACGFVPDFVEPIPDRYRSRKKRASAWAA